jgi:hypothetical protein
VTAAPDHPRWYASMAEESDETENLYYCYHLTKRRVGVFVPRHGDSEFKELSSTAIRANMAFTHENGGDWLSALNRFTLVLRI